MEKTLKDLADNLGYRVAYDLDALTCQIFKPTPRAKYAKEKSIYHYRYYNREQLFKHSTGFLTRIIENKNSYKKRREEERANNRKKAALVNVGDIFATSWGYEQTNVEFYQVIEKPSTQTVIIREIDYTVDHSSDCSSMACYIKPALNNFTGAPERKRLNGDYIVFNSYRNGWLTDPNKAHYMSWYA